jgi:hypothetical protein
MATERQITANRNNAKRSTGPHTSSGRYMSSRNALRHGLSSERQTRTPVPVDIDELAEALTRPEAEDAELVAARQIARAHLDLLRVRAVRAGLLASLDAQNLNTDDLHRLLALDRYERIARGRRRLAVKSLFTQ